MPGERKRSTPAESSERDRLEEDGDVSRTTGELEGEKKLELGREGKQNVPITGPFGRPALGLEKRRNHEGQKLLVVIFYIFIDAKKLPQHVKRVEDFERLATERIRDALSLERFQKRKTEESGRRSRLECCS